MASATSALWGSAPNPFESNSANPAHFTLIGEERPPSPPMPYLARTIGYAMATASAPTGTPISCKIVRFLLVEPTILPAR